LPAHAQFAPFAATNEAVAFGTIFTNVAATQYFLRYSIGTNGVIRGRAVRYDIPAISVSPKPCNGTPVDIVWQKSALGRPISSRADGQIVVVHRAPLMITLSDGAKTKGVAEGNRYSGEQRNYVSIEGFMIYKGSTGSKLSLSNPY